jgi:hypothetical protein
MVRLRHLSVNFAPGGIIRDLSLEPQRHEPAFMGDGLQAIFLPFNRYPQIIALRVPAQFLAEQGRKIKRSQQFSCARDVEFHGLLPGKTIIDN